MRKLLNEKTIYNYKLIMKLIINLKNRFLWTLFNSSNRLKLEYLDWFFEENYKCTEKYIQISASNIILKADMPKIIACYLPQYHEIDINNENFGKGFTEWFKSTKAIPQFTGHYQPHLPIDVGFYNLSHDDTMYRQIELAKKYGIYGFCFYYYWFSGDTLLEKPILNFLNNKELNFPFCLMWTNEQWTNIWGSGNEKKVIKEQKLTDKDDEKFVQDILKYIQDERYIRINNRPLFIIYDCEIFKKERFIKFLTHLRKRVRELISQDIYILTTNSVLDLENKVKDFGL